jgi:phage baseplate assembly protein W
MATYKGVSFKNWGYNKSLVLTDVELVKRDLLNHIYTIRGERVGQRGFGTNIELLLFEPFDENTIARIADQVREVINYDPRVVLINSTDFSVAPYQNESLLAITARLFFVELNLMELFHINLEFES